MSRAIQELSKEHDAILAALVMLDKMSAAASNSLSYDPADMRELLAFLREFVDKCHHSKEEKLLFPAMVAAGVPRQGGIINALLAEHTRGTRLIDLMSAGIGNGNSQQLAAAAKEYIVLLKLHIYKENKELFPLAEQVLSQQRLDELYAAFGAHEEQVIGHGRHEELHAMLERLHARYVGGES